MEHLNVQEKMFYKLGHFDILSMYKSKQASNAGVSCKGVD